jgi:hypothetical protein
LHISVGYPTPGDLAVFGVYVDPYVPPPGLHGDHAGSPRAEKRVEDDVAGAAYALIEKIQVGQTLNAGGKKAVEKTVRQQIFDLLKTKGADFVKQNLEEVAQDLATSEATKSILINQGIDYDPGTVLERAKETAAASAGPLAVLSAVGLGRGGVRIAKNARNGTPQGGNGPAGQFYETDKDGNERKVSGTAGEILDWAQDGAVIKDKATGKVFTVDGEMSRRQKKAAWRAWTKGRGGEEGYLIEEPEADTAMPQETPEISHSDSDWDRVGSRRKRLKTT